jgi:hypothetical protein
MLVHEPAWTANQFAAWLTDAWTRLLLTQREGVPPSPDVALQYQVDGRQCAARITAADRDP